MEIGFVVHHVLAIFGTAMSLFLPLGGGSAAFNACQAEVGSFLYNVDVIFPQSWTMHCVYLVGMLISNVVALYIMQNIWFKTPAMQNYWKIMYGIMCILL